MPWSGDCSLGHANGAKDANADNKWLASRDAFTASALRNLPGKR